MDIIDANGITSADFKIKWYATDKAGNQEGVNEKEIHIDQDYSITFYEDGTYTTEITGDINAQYNDFVYGIAKDSFDQALPQGTKLDLELNNLTYIRTKILDGAGKFSAQILSPDMFTDDLRDIDGAVFEGYNGEIDQDKIMEINSSIGIYEVKIDALSRFFPYKSGDLTLNYSGLDFDDYYNKSLEGFHFDVYVPAVYSTISGSTFSQIDIVFTGEYINGNDTITYDLTYQLSSERIIKQIEQSSRISVWKDMLVKRLSVDVPFYDLTMLYFAQNGALDLNISEFNSIQIVGHDNSIHPEFSYEDPTYSHQMLGCAGIYLYDHINNATMYMENNPQGSSVSYQVSAVIQDLAIDTTIDAQKQMQINRQSITIDDATPECSTITFGDVIHITDLAYSQNFAPFIDAPIRDYFILEATDESYNRVQVGQLLSINKYDNLDFTINGTGGNYTDLRLMYSGNVFFESAEIQLSPTFIKSSNTLDSDIQPWLFPM